MDIVLLKKAAGVSDEDELAEAFGEPQGYPRHLGEDDPELGRVWLWQSPGYEVATYDQGNCTCSVIMVERKN